ncbi:hypothetical protein DESC_740092 [Desulfosarcina cetonica]|uniref:PilZ domain-containing protein n=1 Tax=Desulfosarcina cetonica TaxID=90730 RepID=UPI0006D16B19|nr:PilZ domain-containing protein [Desulfosarcina cetonica]VTR69353.1 hypothetical protein DESC_740092 [Desulfosarcina cetonica]
MGDRVKLSGSKLTQLFNTLIAEKVILSMYIVGTEFDRLTYIAGLEEAEDGRYLLIDLPEDFTEAGRNDEPRQFQFNFNGPDRLEYIFGTVGGHFVGNRLRIPFPKYVERLQRRLNFRINTQPGTQMHFNLKKLHGVLELINISLGGAYGVLAKHNFKFLRGPILKKEQLIFDSSIVFPGSCEAPGDTVYVHKAEVIRVEHDAERDAYRFALKFCAMEKEEKQRLTQAIYDLQRRYLRFRK